MALLQNTKLNGRSISLIVGAPGGDPSASISAQFGIPDANAIDFSGLDIDFTIEKNLKPEPNTCEVLVYNLSEASRKTMSGGHKLTLKLEAGYKGGMSLLYLGDVRSAWTVRSGPDFITHFESGDGEKEIRKNRLNVSYGAKVPVSVALSSIVDALKVGQGNVAHIGAVLQEKGIATINGGSLTGSAALRLTDFCKSAGLEWSIQNGSLQILDLGKALSKQAIEISANTGMVNSPSVDNDGVLSVTTLIIPGLQPGIIIRMNSTFVQGDFRVEQCKWHGQTSGNDWYIDIEAKKI